ncbi:titin-like isoform X2 [Mercenaria mercenaria]|uniref:titin-like isoform X2 n=1 Tax=Mercenaria mercenaria TaxID=6596 RepID=UPI00234E9446|nr:titin-like isoform X2 [Mercenaria mercenaria]
MTEVETELDSRYDDVDVDSILARCRRQGPIKFSRKRCLYQAPEFIKRLPATEEVEEGSTVTFACKVVGFPVPTITWYKDEEVLGSDARAKTDFEDSGIHSIKIKDVSKCDAGIYKIHASNLEAKSKRRNKKKTKRSGNVVSIPPFPAIIERVAEEQKETLENEHQPESPLTPLYCTISRKAPVMWPAFLGDWAYNLDEALQRGEIEEFDVGSEDVFDTVADDTSTESLTFVSTAYAQMYDPATEPSKKYAQNNVCFGLPNETVCDTEDIVHNSCTNNKEKETVSNCSVPNEVPNDHNVTTVNHETISASNETVCDIFNNNDKEVTPTYERNGWTHTEESRDMQNTHQTEVKQMFCDPNTIASISVHRSYAKGDSTSSVARRSPSPFSKSRNLMTCAHNGTYDFTDTTTLQNLNNERILHRMNQKSTCYHRCWCLFRSVATATNWEDYLAEIILLICGSTFLALCFDLAPMTFIIDIVIAMFVKLVLSLVLYDI